MMVVSLVGWRARLRVGCLAVMMAVLMAGYLVEKWVGLRVVSSADYLA
jgi:hypothetical protein